MKTKLTLSMCATFAVLKFRTRRKEHVALCVGRIFCLDCSADHPITKVRVREDDPDYKKDEYMCDLCYREWRKKHPHQVKLDDFVSGR
jgi:hypothetical protein